MIAGLTAALIVTAVLGLSFRTTRQIGIAASAALCFLYWWLALLVIVTTVAVFAANARKP